VLKTHGWHTDIDKTYIRVYNAYIRRHLPAVFKKEPQMSKPILQTVTQEELIEYQKIALSKRKQNDRECLWCGKVVSMRSDQKFCRPACRVAYSLATARIHYEALVKEQAVWQQERAAFVHEVSELRKQVEELTLRLHGQ
jgi:hypothetical protein